VKRKSLAAARFGVCANVFSQSRIHFDAGRGPPPPALLLELAQVRSSRTASDDFDDEHVAAAPSRGDLQTTIH
jgi:hypothetical protein